jgi:hypothetical protein
LLHDFGRKELDMLKPPSGFTSPPDEQAWEKHGHRVTLLVEHGRREMRLHGVPYGARARMILLYLQTQVELGEKASRFVHRDRQLLH